MMIEFTELAYNVSGQPNSVQSKVRAMEKQIKLIQKYQQNTDDLFEKCMFILKNDCFDFFFRRNHTFEIFQLNQSAESRSQARKRVI